jgi:penicillin-binding protein 1A
VAQTARRVARHAGLAFAFLLAAILGSVSGALWVYAGDLPQISALDDYSPSTITRLYAADGQVIGEFATERRVVVTYDQISPLLRQAIVAAEDQTFDDHIGFNIPRIIATLVRDLVEQRLAAGASTLTMQLARKLFLTDDKTWERKIKETILAVQIEKRYTKEEIFTMYCNQMYFGHGAYGVEAASRLYFDKSARDLTLEEAALIAGILQGNVRQSPYVNMPAAVRRRNYALQRMAEEGMITRGEAEAAGRKPIVTRGRPLPADSPAPYFVEEVRQELEATYGAKQLYENGLQIQTSLDLGLQQVATTALEAGLKRLNRGRSGPLVEGAILALDNRTGQIRAMVGGSDFARTKFNRAMQASRQIGSTIKVVVYTAAIDRGYTAASTIVDEPVAYPAGPGQPLYKPANYDRAYEGPITLRRALEQSRNVPTVKLMHELGPTHVIDYARRLGFTSTIHPYLSSALGASEATLIETTTAFSVFPNQGVRMKPYGVVKVTDRAGNVLAENRPQATDAIRADTAFVMTHLLRNVVERGTASRAAALNWPLGGKTGTTDAFSDAWFVGFDPDITVGVWVGMDQRKPLGPGMSGSVAALPIWIDVMKAWIDSRRDRTRPEFSAPGNIVFVDDASGVRDAFIAGTQPGATFGDD